MRTRSAIAGLALLVSGCSFTKGLPAYYTCTTSADCPSGSVCGKENRCATQTAADAQGDAPVDLARAEVTRDRGADAKLDGALRLDGVLKPDKPGPDSKPMPDVVPKADSKPKPDSKPPPDSNPCTAPVAPTGLAPDRIVSAAKGDDTKADGKCIPYKTITAALQATGLPANAVVWVAPGSYTLGESFPLFVPATVRLIGETATKGMGATPTEINGAGGHGASFKVTLIGGKEISGFKLVTCTSATPTCYAIHADESAATISYNTFATGYGGVFAMGNTSCPLVQYNAFTTASYGVYAPCTGPMTIQFNNVDGPALAVAIPQGSQTIRNNTINLNGTVGVQIQNGNAAVTDNIFTRVAGSTAPSISVANSSTPKVRGNLFPSGPAVRIQDSSNPDLGNATNGGGNTFVSGAVLDHLGTATPILAYGNSWAPPNPACGTQITIKNAGKQVCWAPSQCCPL